MALGLAGDLKIANWRRKLLRRIRIIRSTITTWRAPTPEQGNATKAKKHLQEAFDRRKEDVIQGETMPDPAKDDSILKLKGNKAFWEFVMSLPTN